MPISFFARKAKEMPVLAANAPELPSVAYDPDLIAMLTEDHRELALLLERAKFSVLAQRYDEVNNMLDHLREGLAAHTQREAEKLHAYITAHLKGPERTELLKGMNAASIRTQRALEGFLRHYGGYPVTERNAATFYNEIEGVAEEFNRWLNQEEVMVYSLYKSPEYY